MQQMRLQFRKVSTHSRAEAAALRETAKILNMPEFQHTAARRRLPFFAYSQLKELRFQHTAARRRLLRERISRPISSVFQHTAARRRLQNQRITLELSKAVSTHSRAEAAATAHESAVRFFLFQHTAARRRLLPT